jgi:penicillin-binding protein-related factor A (putative recombinase)
MRETVFQKEWRASFNFHCPGAHFIKVPDMPRVGDSRFIPRKPYDCYMLVDGRFLAFELKWMKSLTGFAFNNVTTYQIESLMEVYRNSGGAYIAINYRKYDVSEKHQKQFGVDKRVNFVAIMNVRHFIALDEAGDSASISFQQVFADNDIVIIPKKRGEEYWDFKKVLAYTVPIAV